MIGSLRHEASHALVAILQGAKIQQFVFWPTWSGSTLRWRYVSWSGSTNWVATAAPYLCDLTTFTLAFVICARWPLRGHWAWVNLVAMGLISPLVNSAYNYCTGLRGRGDVAQLLHILPGPAVDSFFAVTLLLYTVGLVWTLWPRAVVAVCDDG